MNFLISECINDLKKTLESLTQHQPTISAIEQSIDLMIGALRQNKKILIAGNGGSAADAQHFAAELVGRFYLNRKALPAIALTTDTSIITAIGNDFGFEEIFARQIEALGNAGDIFIGITTSGNSPNILKAAAAAKEAGLITIGLTGTRPSQLENNCDLTIKAPSEDTPRIQECHLMIEHIICGLIEKKLFPVL